MDAGRRSGRLGAVVLVLFALAQPAASIDYAQSGSCFDVHGIHVESCSDVSDQCGWSSCQSANGYISYTCYSPDCSGRAYPVVSTQSPTTPSSSNGGYDQSGTCYTERGIVVTSCNDLSAICSSRTCGSTGGKITFSCSRPFSCSGVATKATPTPTPWTAGSSNCITGRGLSLTTCADTSSFVSIGCTCFTCLETNGHIALGCRAPFQCSNDFDAADADEDGNPPALNASDYVVICVVFVGTAGAYAGAAWIMRPKPPGNPLVNESNMLSKIKAFMAPSHLVALAAQMAEDAVRSLVISPNVRSDGRTTTLLEFCAATNLWFALLSLSGCCCCARPRQVPPNYKPPMSFWRALGDLLTETSLTFSLAFLLGTVVDNSSACSTVINGNYCKQGATTISITGNTSTSAGQCQSVDVAATAGAVVLTTVLTKAVTAAFGYAESTAEEGGKRKWVIVVGGCLVRAALLAFGVGYSFSLTAKTSGSEAAMRRYSTIWTVLLWSWLSDQLAGMGNVLLQRLGIALVWCLPKRVRVAKADQSASSVVRPAADGNPLAPPGAPTAVLSADPSGVALQSATAFDPDPAAKMHEIDEAAPTEAPRRL